MKQSILLLTCLAIILFASCSGSEYYIDNPTDKEVSVSIDGQAPVKVGAHEFKLAEGKMKAGEHTLQVDGGEVVKFTSEDVYGFVNITNDPYIECSMLYGNGKDTTTIRKININGVMYEGPFSERTGHYISISDINFFPHEDFKNEVKIAGNKSFVIYKKLVRKNEFKKFYEKEFE